MQHLLAGVLLASLAALAACSSLPVGLLFGPTDPLRLVDLQMVGSHNSYKTEIPPPILSALAASDGELAAALQYYHLPIGDQLDRGVRQLELDVFVDREGGRFAAPLGEQILAAAGAASRFDAALWRRPGFKVMHIQDLDYGTHCVLLSDCLAAIAAWSERNPRHLPLILTINAKEAPIDLPGAALPVPFSAEHFGALDREIRDVIGRERLYEPDELRGPHARLEDAVVLRGWPRVADARGKVIFVLDAPARLTDIYREGHASLKGRAMFASFREGEAEAAFHIINDPIAEGARIKALVGRGFMVRTRSDADTVEARRGDRRRLEAAIASGAQVISTDYYPGAPDPLGLKFEVTLGDGRMAACNPVRGNAGCRLAE